MDPRQLPVYDQRAKILDHLADNQVIVVESPTGSGKTTQLPIILHEAGYDKRGVIGITQPRRIAAVSVSAYIRRQLETEQGEAAKNYTAFKMRFIDETTQETRIKIMTDGILLQEMKADPMLSRYSVIMVDEAHERSLNIDFILGLLKRSAENRPDLKIIISSATINAEVFSAYFNDAPVVRIDTETFPVSTVFAPPSVAGDPEVLIDKIVDIVGHVLEEKREGDMLIFLSGEKMIKDCISALYSQPYRKKLHILPLYGRLSKEEQDEVFPPPPEGKHKVVVATNIAETSITIDGITTVIDSGLAKMNFYNPRTYTSSLIEKQISRASANQRKGRAGRTRPGTVYRLYQREDFDHRPLFTQEEIYRTDLSEVVLRMAELGIRDFESFDFISSPGRAGIASAVETLMLLDALTDDRDLSQIGKYMARFPLLPRHSRMIVESMLKYPDVMDEVLIATSFLTSSNPFLLPQGQETEARNAHHNFRDKAGDFVSYLRLYHAFRDSTKKEKFCERHFLDYAIMLEILNVKEQLSDIVGEMGMPISAAGLPLKGDTLAQYICALAKGLIQFICVRTGRSSYRSLTAERVDIHPGSVMFRESPDFIVAGEIVKTSRTFARSVSPIMPEWLPRISKEVSEHLLHKGRGPAPSGRDARRQDAPDSRKGGKRGRKLPAEARGAVSASSPPQAREKIDSSWQISLGGHVYDLKPWKGKKKILELDWRELASLSRMSHLELVPQYQDLRVLIRWQNRTFLKSERLGRALKIARMLSPELDGVEAWPRNARFSPWESPLDLSDCLEFLMKITSSGKKKDRELGFIALYTDGQGLYWLRPLSSFQAALSETLASLDSLIDDVVALEAVRDQGGGQTLPPGIPELKETTGQQYRRLSDMLESV
jgi:ATP-dependent helicase HrpA